MGVSRIGAGLVLPVLLAAVGCWRAISFHNDCIVAEKALVATWKESQLEYDNLWKSVSEAAQVTDAYADGFKEVFLGGIQGRYGPRGNQAALSFIREANPSLDSRMYAEILRMIEEGRDQFTATQQRVNQAQQVYDTSLSTFPNSLLANALGFPRALEGEYAPTDDADGDGRITALDYRIVSSSRSADAFASGREEEPMQPFGER